MDDVAPANLNQTREERDMAREMAAVTLMHSKIKKPLMQLMDILEDQLDGMAPSGAFVTGPAGVGKTTLMRAFMERAVRNLGISRDQMIQISLQGSLNLTGVYTKILQSIGDPRGGNGTNQQKLQRIVELCKRRHIEVVMIDEVHHLWENEYKSDIYLAEVANAFKAIIDHGRTSVIVFGVEAALELWRQDDQIARRMCAPISIETFTVGSEDDREEWHAMMARFREVFTKHSVGIDMDETDFADRMFVSCDGMVSRATQLILTAAVRAARHTRAGENGSISHESMKGIAAKYLSEASGHCNGFELTPTQLRSQLNPVSDNQLADRAPDTRQIISKK